MCLELSGCFAIWQAPLNFQSDTVIHTNVVSRLREILWAGLKSAANIFVAISYICVDLIFISMAINQICGAISRIAPSSSTTSSYVLSKRLNRPLVSSCHGQQMDVYKQGRHSMFCFKNEYLWSPVSRLWLHTESINRCTHIAISGMALFNQSATRFHVISSAILHDIIWSANVFKIFNCHLIFEEICLNSLRPSDAYMRQ